jgi:pimeloyl-ACP methyl ester carboxylesterase
MSRLESLLAEGRRDDLLETMYRDLVQMSQEEVDAIKAAPTWPLRVAAAHTVPREIRAFAAQAFDPVTAARIRVPTLLLVGGDTPEMVRAEPEVVAAALPDARIRTLEGQAHVAYLTAPEAFAEELLSFLRE